MSAARDRGAPAGFAQSLCTPGLSKPDAISARSL